MKIRVQGIIRSLSNTGYTYKVMVETDNDARKYHKIVITKTDLLNKGFLKQTILKELELESEENTIEIPPYINLKEIRS